MRIRVAQPHVTDELIAFLRRLGFTVDESEYATIEVAAADLDRSVLKTQLQLYLHVWQATRSGVEVTVEWDAETATGRAAEDPV